MSFLDNRISFFAALVLNVARGLDISCGCFSTSSEHAGGATMVEFGAMECKPCHMRDDQVSVAGYGSAFIPARVLFDKTGKEFFRHVGFFPQNEVEKKVSEIGDVIDETSS